MGTDAAEVVAPPCSFKVHHLMCTELKKLVDKTMRVFPEIEAARPRCSSGIKALCSLNLAIDKAKLLLQYCSESSKLYMAITTDAIVSRCQKSKNLLEQGLCQIQNMVPVALADEISVIIADLRAINFVPDKFEEEAGKVVKELLQRGAAASDSMEYAEMKALQTAASRLHITSSRAVLIEKRSLKKLLEKVSDTDQQKKKILTYLLYLLKRYANLIIGEQTDNTTDQTEGAFPSNGPCINSKRTHYVDAEPHEQCGAQADKLSSVRPPEEFICPVSSRLMYDPVVIASGQTFERFWIQKWFDEGNNTCPKTKMKLLHLSLTPNAAMKDLISKWCMKYGITVQDPSMKVDVLSVFENSSSSIASLGSSMNDLHFPVDISNISLGSLDTSYTSDGSRKKIADGLSPLSKQTNDDLCQYQSPCYLESLFSLPEHDWESQYKMVEDMKNHWKCDDRACLSMPSKNFVEPLIKFLWSAQDLNDIRALRAGFQLLSAFLSKNRNGVQYLDDDAYSLLLLLPNSDVTKEVLDLMEILSGLSSCRSKIAASSVLDSILNILDSKVKDNQEQAIKILCNLSSCHNICSDLVSSECTPKCIPFLEDTKLASHCIVLLKNLCNHQDARVSITQTPGCINSIALLLESSKHEDQEHALAILLGLCSQSVDYCHLVMDEGDIFPALMYLSINGSEKGKASALELQRLLRGTICIDEEQECLQSDNVASKEASTYAKDKKSHKSLFGVKFPVFTRSSALKKKR